MVLVSLTNILVPIKFGDGNFSILKKMYIEWLYYIKRRKLKFVACTNSTSKILAFWGAEHSYFLSMHCLEKNSFLMFWFFFESLVDLMRTNVNLLWPRPCILFLRNLTVELLDIYSKYKNNVLFHYMLDCVIVKICCYVYKDQCSLVLSIYIFFLKVEKPQIQMLIDNNVPKNIDRLFQPFKNHIDGLFYPFKNHIGYSKLMHKNVNTWVWIVCWVSSDSNMK